MGGRQHRAAQGQDTRLTLLLFGVGAESPALPRHWLEDNPGAGLCYLGERGRLPGGQYLGPAPDGPWWQWLGEYREKIPPALRAQPLLLLDARVPLPPLALERLLHAAGTLEQPAVLSPLHPRHPALAALDEHPAWQAADARQRDAACFLLNDPVLLPQAWLNPQAVWMQPALLEADGWQPEDLAENNACWLQPDLLLGSPDMAAGEGAGDSGQLRRMVSRLRDWPQWPPACWPGLQPEPVILHVTHDWGGGTEQWLRDYCAAEDHAIHLVLRSLGDWKSQRYGQRLQLQLGPTGPVLREWPLQPAIRGVAGQHAGWKSRVEALLERFQVQRVLVSSLIGHSLEALNRPRTRTLWLLHDYFPYCPALNLYFGEVCRQCDAKRMGACFAENPCNRLLQPRQPSVWLQRRQQVEAILEQAPLEQAAPSRRVLEQLRRIHPAWVREDAAVIPHGLPAALAQAEPLPLPEDYDRSEKLRLVVPGQLSTAKGLKLLQQAWPRLAAYCELYLLGCGKEGRAFWGLAGVHVIPRYQREQLPEQLRHIRPHLALFLSTVPETFGLALVEHMHLHVVPVATRLGAFAEHVEDSRTGCLISPDAQALVDCVQALAQDRARIAALHQNLQGWKARDLQAMVADYRKRLGLRRKKSSPRYTVRPLTQAALLNQEQTLTQALAAEATLAETREQLRAQQTELEKRAQWARRTEQELQERTQWALAMRKQILKQESEIRGLRKAVQEITETRNNTRAALEQEQQRRAAVERDQQQLQHQLQQKMAIIRRLEQDKAALLASTSWKVTRPLRLLGHALKVIRQRGGYYLHHSWSLWRGLLRNLRTRGLRGTWQRIQERLRGRQQAGRQDPVALTVAEVPEPVAATEPQTALDLPPLPVLPRAAKPRVSIVIPVYNQLHHTLACLRSLAETVGEIPVEIIVVDDCSGEDATPELLPRVEGLVYLRNEENLGFVGSCNRGAAEAHGEYLFFLNNDTQVQPGWLPPLLRQFEQRPETGLVGSQLVYPDGRLQESGGIVFSDASGWNVGRFEHPDDPRYHYARQVDYCSGAAILLPRALFEQLGGFDEIYAPAYYEDTDLAFKVRQHGREVWVQPASRVVHFEGVTCGTDTGSGVKKHQLINQKTFRERWAEALALQPPPGSPIDLAKEHRVAGRVLIIDACTPTPDQDSGSVRMQNLFRLFQQLGWKVSFLPENHARLEPYTARFQAMGVEMLHAPWFDGPGWFERRGHEFDLVILSRHYVASQYLDLVHAWMPQARVWFDTVDLHYLREQRQAALENSETLRRQAAQTREQELKVARSCDLTLVVSPVEQQELAEVAPEVDVAVLSNIHHLPETPGLPFEQRQGLVFVGGYQHPPNVDAAHWFVEAIFPLIRAELPEVEFHLVGSKAPDSVRALGEREGVVFHGFVEEIEPFMREVRLAVAPLRYGAGVKGKVNMSMAHGQPVVGTPMAFEGMYAEHGVHGLMAETAEDFAREVVRAYGDPQLWQRLSEGGRENVLRHFSMQAARERLESLLPQTGGTAGVR